MGTATTMPPDWMLAGIPATELARIEGEVMANQTLNTIAPTQVSQLTNSVVVPPGGLPPADYNGSVAATETAIPSWLLPFLATAVPMVVESLSSNGNGNGNGTGLGTNQEAYEDFGGTGRKGREGIISSGRTTDGTGVINTDTFRAWDPIQQKYYQLEGDQALSNITLTPGKVVPGMGMITKSWVTNAWRKDMSLATTQMAMLSNGRMVSISEDGRMKSWRPYKSIVIGKKLTSSNVRRVSARIKSHAKSLRSVLKILK